MGIDWHTRSALPPTIHALRKQDNRMSDLTSGKTRWPAAIARRVADELVEALTSRCEQVCVTGSLPRGQAAVGDIKILYPARIGPVRSPGWLFPKPGSLADELLEQWLTQGVLAKRPNKNGVPAWGALNKLATH